MTNLTEFFRARALPLNVYPNEIHDGHMSPSQQEQFTKQIERNSSIRKVAEIGLNAGHSAEHFFLQCPHLEQFVSFDLNLYPATRLAVEYFTEKYQNRFQFIEGDSLIKVPEFAQKKGAATFDLIYVDGCHLFQWTLGDILNGKQLAHEKTLLWVDDVKPSNQVGQAVQFLETIGFIQVEEKFRSDDPIYGERNWIQARYLWQME